MRLQENRISGFILNIVYSRMSANSLQHRTQDTMTLLLAYRPYYFKHEVEKDEVILT